MSKEENRKARREFENRFSDLVGKYADRLSEREMQACISACFGTLDERSTPTVSEPSYDAETNTIILSYSDPEQLEAELHEFLELHAICVDVGEVPLMHDVTVRVIAGGDSVDLEGRTVQQTPDGTAIQVFSTAEKTRTNLEALPEKLRSAPEETPSRPPEPAKTEQARRPRPASQSDLFGPSSTSRSSEDDSDLFGPPSTSSRTDDHGPPPGSASDSDLFGTSSKSSRRTPTLADRKPIVDASHTWDLREKSVTDILLQLAANQATGMLEIGTGARKLVAIERGSVRDIESMPRHEDESLTHLLVSANQLDDDDAEKARDYADTHGITAREALLNLGIVPYRQIEIALKTRVVYLFDTLWQMVGSAKFYPSEEPPTNALSTEVSLNDAVFNHILQTFRDDPERFEAEQDAYSSIGLAVVENPPPTLMALDLHPAQEDLMQIKVKQTKSLAQLTRLAHSDPQESLAAVKTLVSLGYFEERERREHSRVRTKTVEQIDIIHARLDSTNHFDVLGCHWSAYDEEVEESYRKVMEKLDPERLGSSAESEDDLKERLEEARERVKEAYSVLEDPDSRSVHRKEVVDAFKLESSVDMFERQADTAKLRRDIDAAIDFLKRVVELRPMNHSARREIKALKKLR